MGEKKKKIISPPLCFYTNRVTIGKKAATVCAFGAVDNIFTPPIHVNMNDILTDVRENHPPTAAHLRQVETILETSSPLPLEVNCLICYEDVIYSTPDPESNRYTHLMCCSKRICDGCAKKAVALRGVCPFCNQSVLDIIKEQGPSKIIDLYIAGIARRDPDSYFTFASLIGETHPALTNRLYQALAEIQFQPAMIRLAMKKMQKHTLELSSMDLFLGMLREESPILRIFQNDMVPILTQLEPSKLVAELVESASAVDEDIRIMAIRHGIGVACDYCAAPAGTYACPCNNAAYCNQKCQAAHWNTHGCEKKAIQLVGLSARRYNGMTAERVRYNRKKKLYIVLLEGREVLIDPLKAYVLP